MAALNVAATQPPEPEAAGSVTRFSVERAAEHVRRLASEPRPAGTAAHDSARAYITDELESLGLEVQWQQESVVLQWGSGLLVGGKVSNVLARSVSPSGFEGPAVALLAHYDSRPNTPGAADDASGVAIVLETMRVLAEEDRLVRPVMALITDLEEIGLLGARAFVDRHPWLDEIDVLINVEARGSSGPSIMFETTPGNLELAAAYEAATPYPVSNSLSYEVYRRMPNDSDFTVFKDVVAAGFNLAFIGDHPAYHTRLDSIERLDQSSLYQQGANVTELARWLATSERRLRSDEDGVYFSLFGSSMIVYAARAAGTMSVALVLLAAIALWQVRQGEVWTVSVVLKGALLTVLLVVGGFLIATVLWEILGLVGGRLLGGPHGRPYATNWFGAAIVLALMLWAAFLAGRWVAVEQRLGALAGALLIWTFGAVVLSWTVVGASYLLVWPVFAAWIGWWLIARSGGSSRPTVTQLVTALASIPAVVLLVPTVVLFLDALTLSGAGVPAALLGLLMSLFVAQLGALGTARSFRWLLIAGATGCLVVGVVLSLPTAERPHVNSLFYVENSSDRSWYSFDDVPDQWLARVLGDDPEHVEAPSELFLGGGRILRSQAPALDLTASVVEVIESADTGSRAFELRPGSGGQVLRLRASSPGVVTGVSVDGERFEIAPEDGDARMTLLGPPDAVWTIALEVEDSTAPVDLEILEQRYGLPDELVPARPPHLIPSSSWRTDSTFVVGRARL